MSGLSRLTDTEWSFIALVLECFFYGIYSAIFFMYFQYQVSQKAVDKRPTVILYSLCSLYVLSITLLTTDMWVHVIPFMHTDTIYIQPLVITSSVISGCCDFVAQSIMIYRCWIVWNRNVRVVIIPAILSIGSLVLWLAAGGSQVYDTLQRRLVVPEWGNTVTLTCIAISLAVNALVTGLIVLKIFKVYCEIKPLYGQTFGNTGGSKLRPIIFVIIESGLALFCIQLAYLVVVLLETQSGIDFIVYIQRMLNGITPTIIQVRVSMGLSFHDQESMEEVTSGLHFGSVDDHQNSTPGTGDDINIDHQENRDDNIGMQQCNEIEKEEIGRVNNNDIRQSDDFDIVELQRDTY